MRQQNHPGDLKEQIHNFLKDNCLGRSRAIRALDIGSRFSIDIREVNAVIHSLRLDGVLIGSSKERPYGYYLPANELEAKKFLDTYGAEMFDMLSVYNRQKRAKRDYLDQFNNQGSFNFNKEATGQLAFIS